MCVCSQPECLYKKRGRERRERWERREKEGEEREVGEREGER